MDDFFRQWQLADDRASLAQRKMMHGWVAYTLGSTPAPSAQAIGEYKSLRLRADARLKKLLAKIEAHRERPRVEKSVRERTDSCG